MAGKRRADGPASKRPAPKAKPRRTWKSRLRRVALWGGVAGLVLALIGAGGFLYLYKTIDIPEANAEFLTETSFVYYDGGEDELGRFATQFRDSIPLDEMSDDVKDAVVAAENQTFWSDSGIDPKGILRAAFSNASGNSTQGASTITQQYVKILYLTQERSYTRKLKEAILSLKVQRTFSKEQVLEGYLNTIYFGRGAYGVEAAASAYFDKPASRLDLRESAVLATVLNNPTRFDPDNGKDARQALKGRYQYVLGNMAELDDITEEEAEQAARRLPKFPEVEAESTYGGQKGHMLQMVRGELNRLGFSDEEIDGGGLRVTTTFTEKAMAAAEEGVEEIRPDVPRPKALHVGVASVEPGTGAVRGFYGGQDYLDSQINWAVAGGQAGSTFKPFAVAAAIKQGYSLRNVFDGSSPYVFPDGSEVGNQGGSSPGPVSLLTATEDSVNTAFIDLTVSMDDGEQAIIDTANDMGIPPAEASRGTRGFPDSTPGLDDQGLGVSLGAQTVSPINMANAYATIANGGVASEPYIIEKVVDADGETQYQHKVSEERAISEDIAADVSYALQQVVETGSGDSAQALGRPAAGKTGTATKTGGDVSSSWFAGFTPQMSTAVMYVRGQGNGTLDKDWLPTSSDGKLGYFGGNYPAKTWTAVMSRDMEGLDVEDFPDPVFVDGEAPESDHEPYVPPPPPPPAPEPEPPRDPQPEGTVAPPETFEPTEEPEPEPEPEPSEPSEPSEPTETETDDGGIIDPGDEPNPGQGQGPGQTPGQPEGREQAPTGQR